ncbi:XisH family protein [Pannus brasiliensis CCIBt3594]|uniref:XisH family protein n=1 Tax=Pannus brasiliensis CCIBt3594 TaxID=1427578 RepID=A0AAW9QRP8_9CHRO
MSARDKFHGIVRIALEKDGWTITADPLHLSFGGVDMYIDLAAERLIAAEKDGQTIAVEIKSFLGSSTISDFHLAIGQFINYRTILTIQEPYRTLYLAIPEEAYNGFFKLEFAQTIIQSQNLKLIVYDPEKGVIFQWKN